ncbi:MAG: single-stranded-DNA-specific exonuclease RecJ, partial [Flavobacteriales bacterium]|nr:single-stranded-DNA-specific exonuclease RecJ [Flavobacteriales bacterium]
MNTEPSGLNASIFHWDVKTSKNNEKLHLLLGEMGIDQWFAPIFEDRGLNSEAQIRTFFNPTSQLLHSPFLMNGMEEAVEVMNTIVAHQQKVMVFGDYDVDGTTAAAMMSDFLFQLEVPHEVYIPDRHKEGYGLSTKAVEEAVQNGCKLLITLDC